MLSSHLSGVYLHPRTIHELQRKLQNAKEDLDTKNDAILKQRHDLQAKAEHERTLEQDIQVSPRY